MILIIFKISSKKAKKGLDNLMANHYNNLVAWQYGGIAQLARAFGSYPKCRWFKSDCRYHMAKGCRNIGAFSYGPVVKRLRHRPFTAVTRVRFPSGSPISYAPVAQLDRVFGYEPKGRGFESLPAYQNSIPKGILFLFVRFIKTFDI